MIGHLLIIDGELEGQTFNIEEGGSISLGRSKENRILLTDLKLSKQHCRIEHQQNQFVLFDLDSRNGTYVNSERVIALPLKPGDEIQLGDVHVIFEISPNASDQAPKVKKVTFSPEVFREIEKELQKKHKQQSCSLCQNLIPSMDFVLGKAKKIEDRYLCGNCVDPHLGKVFGGYQIIEMVGKGGMGNVYKGKELQTERIIAIKILHEYMTLDKKAVKRFLKEAQLGMSLEHPNIVQCYDSGEFEDTYFLVMEFVQGEPLSTLIEKGTIGFREIIHAILQVAKVLELTQKKQIIHRDIKPENILIGAGGVVKLADLGVAKSLNESNIIQPTQSQEGMGIGSAYYMAPEQVFDALHVNTTADIYGLGVTFYYALTKRYPFTAKNPQEYLLKLQSEEPTNPRIHNPKIPEAIANLILKMIDKEPQKRIQEPEKLTAYLSKVLQTIQNRKS
jgi:tRNA A-37 threonylcarbamoyl transferase component Bud32